MPVLDTDVLTIIQRRGEPAYGRLATRLNALPSASVFTTIISFEEQLRGWLEYVKKAKPAHLPAAYLKLSELNRDYSDRIVLPFDNHALDIYDQLVEARIRIGAMDLRIAAITLAADDLLISRNLVHFRKVPGLRVEDWTE